MNLSSKEKIAKEELHSCARTTGRNTKAEAPPCEWLIGRQPVPVTENEDTFVVTFEFNHEQHSWDYSWKSNRWVVDETHCFDIIVFKPDATNRQVVHQVKYISSKPFTIFSARHIKKNNYGNGEGLSLAATMTYAAATSAMKSSDPAFIKKKAISSDERVIDSERTAAAVAGGSIKVAGPLSCSSRTPKSTPKTTLRRVFRNSLSESATPYAREYSTSRYTAQRLTERLMRSQAFDEDELKYRDSGYASDSSFEFDPDEQPNAENVFGTDSGSSAAKALALAVTGALVELGSESAKSRKRKSRINGGGGTETPGRDDFEIMENGSREKKLPCSAATDNTDFNSIDNAGLISTDFDNSPPKTPLAAAAAAAAAAMPSVDHSVSSPPKQKTHMDALLLIHCARSTPANSVAEGENE
jgi:hypothetical protein